MRTRARYLVPLIAAITLLGVGTANANTGLSTVSEDEPLFGQTFYTGPVFSPASIALASTGTATARIHRAVLRGTVNTRGANTRYWFQLGRTKRYGLTTPKQTLLAPGAPTSQGGLTVTGRSTDIAIDGPGFFTLSNSYARQGSFAWFGYETKCLVTEGGYLRGWADDGNGAPNRASIINICVPGNTVRTAVIHPDGRVTSEDPSGQVIARGWIFLTTFEDASALSPFHWRSWAATPDAGAATPDIPGGRAGVGSIQVGSLETLPDPSSNPVRFPIRHLASRTRYHYRIVARNRYGYTLGRDRVMVTK